MAPSYIKSGDSIEYASQDMAFDLYKKRAEEIQAATDNPEQFGGVWHVQPWRYRWDHEFCEYQTFNPPLIGKPCPKCGEDMGGNEELYKRKTVRLLEKRFTSQYESGRTFSSMREAVAYDPSVIIFSTIQIKGYPLPRLPFHPDDYNQELNPYI